VLLLLWHMELQIAISMKDSDEHDEELLELVLLGVRYEITILLLPSFGKQQLYLRQTYRINKRATIPCILNKFVE
jgi:hypothetical protein